MKHPQVPSQRRRVRKTAYIALKNALRSHNQSSRGQYLLASESNLDPGTQVADFLFLHSTKRLAIWGYLATCNSVKQGASWEKVMAELDVTHPIPDDAYFSISGPGGGEPGETLIAAEWIDVHNAREEAGAARMSQLMAEPSTIEAMLKTSNSDIFAIHVVACVDRPCIGEADIIEVIQRFRELGEPLVSGVRSVTKKAMTPEIIEEAT